MHLQSYLETITKRIDTSTVQSDIIDIMRDLDGFVDNVKLVKMLLPDSDFGHCIGMDYDVVIADAEYAKCRARDLLNELPIEFEDRRVR